MNAYCVSCKETSYIRWWLLLLLLTSYDYRASTESAICRDETGVRSRQLQPHPSRCDQYIECSNGRSYVRQCGPALYFNTEKRVCDFMHTTACLKPPVSDLVSYMTVVIAEAKALAVKQLDNEIFVTEQLSGVVDSAPFRYVYNFLKSKPYTKTISRSGVMSLAALKLVSHKFGFSGDEMMQAVHKAGVSKMLRPLVGAYRPDTEMPVAPDIDYCPYPTKLLCRTDAAQVRTIDGSCNNLQQPLDGRSMTPFRRLLPAKYADGIEEFRHSVTGGPLPGARFLSFNLFRDLNRPSVETTMMFVFFGQLTDHDLTRTAATLVPDPAAGKDRMREIKCGRDGCLQGVEGLESCAPIPVPLEDPDFARFNHCLKFVRNLEVPHLNCELGAREQLNQVTHWLDGSQVYGSTKDELDLLRDYSNVGRGGMAVVSHPSRLKSLLPREVVTTEPSMCKDINATVHCFQAGDPRVNENAGLGVLHTVLVRQHNLIEAQLHSINEHWSGEQLFKETRRIMIAVLQHITYNEWLPLLLGPHYIEKFELRLLEKGYFKGYNPAVDGRIPNSFATAAFRLGHTLLQERIRRANEHYQHEDSLFLSETFNHPEHMYNTEMGGIDGLIRGLTHEPSQTYDQFFTKQVSRSLFAEQPPHGPGHDLLSLNIQRGRDHGLASYNDYREFCGLGRAHSFDDLAKEIVDNDHRQVLASVYQNVEDIDLFVGGVSEFPVTGGIAGPTFACIVAHTFRNLRLADRFWYENEQAGFTPAQLHEIRKMTIARILCANGDTVYDIQPFAFLQPGRKLIFAGSRGVNVLHPCDSLPDLNLSAWRNN